MENYKEKLFQLLEQHLKDKEQADIKKICVMIEDKYITDLNEHYKSIYSLFQDSNYSYMEFKLNLSKRILLLQYRNAIVMRQRAWEGEEEKRFQESLNRVEEQIQKSFKELSETEQIALAFSIAEKTLKFKMQMFVIDEKIAVLSDKISIMSIGTQPIKQIDLLCQVTKEKIASKTVIDLLQKEFFEYIQIRRFQFGGDKNELKKEIKQLKIEKKHQVSLAIRSVVESLVSKGILTQIAPKDNSYKIMNANGECIELPNTMAIKVYDIVKALGFDTSFKRHKKLANTTYEKDYQTPDLDEEKKDYVKDRLKRSAELNINTEEKEFFFDYHGHIL